MYVQIQEVWSIRVPVVDVMTHSPPANIATAIHGVSSTTTAASTTTTNVIVSSISTIHVYCNVNVNVNEIFI